MSDDSEIERLRKENEELRDLVRALSASLMRAVGALPLDAALALARGRATDLDPPFRLEHWQETAEMTRGEVAGEMELLWKRLPPQGNA